MENNDSDRASARILLVEDSPTQAAGMKAVLAERWTEIAWAKDGGEALAMVKRDRPSIVVSDIEMPVVTGFELSRVMKGTADLRHIPIILLTELASPMAITQSIDSEADCLMMKPCDPDRLYAVIDRLLDRAATAAAQGLCDVSTRSHRLRNLLEFALEELADQHHRLLQAEEALELLKYRCEAAGTADG